MRAKVRADLMTALPVQRSNEGKMFERIFLEHPRSVGETYLEHQRSAFGFAMSLARAAIACFIHGLVPAVFRETGSSTVSRLHSNSTLPR